MDAYSPNGNERGFTAHLRHRLSTTAVLGVVIASVALQAPATGQSPASATDTSRGLRIQWADGRITTGALRHLAVCGPKSFRESVTSTRPERVHR
jgi:hypothetical protein